jgi:hypothetical protein
VAEPDADEPVALVLNRRQIEKLTTLALRQIVHRRLWPSGATALLALGVGDAARIDGRWTMESKWSGRRGGHVAYVAAWYVERLDN